MERWRSKIAVVTGAGQGVGACVARRLAELGMEVVAVDIQEDKVQDLASSVNDIPDHGKIHPLKANLRNEQEIFSSFEWIDEKLGGADFLVNNAGILSASSTIDGETEEWRAVLELNVLAVAVCNREFLKSLQRRNNTEGHIIIISSVGAHTVQYGRAVMYYASKHAVKAMAMCLRRELAEKGSAVKVTCVSPGRIHTDMGDSMGGPNVVALQPADVATAVVDALSASPVTQVCDVIITPVPTLYTIY